MVSLISVHCPLASRRLTPFEPGVGASATHSLSSLKVLTPPTKWLVGWGDIFSFGYGYGLYCGFSRRGPGAPVDYLDACCQAHDQCLATWWDIWKLVLCACQLALCCLNAIIFGCGFWDIQCKYNAGLIKVWATIQCPIAAIIP